MVNLLVLLEIRYCCTVAAMPANKTSTQLRSSTTIAANAQVVGGMVYYIDSLYN